MLPYGTDYQYAGGGKKAEWRQLGIVIFRKEGDKIILLVCPEDDFYSGEVDVTGYVNS